MSQQQQATQQSQNYGKQVEREIHVPGSKAMDAYLNGMREKEKGKKQRKYNIGAPSDAGDKKHKSDQNDRNKVPIHEAQTGYIHVRARRGQATGQDKENPWMMKLLQALVPGGDKVNGKALMLDEIINYVQSLQNQVEFLSKACFRKSHII